MTEENCTKKTAARLLLIGLGCFLLNVAIVYIPLAMTHLMPSVFPTRPSANNWPLVQAVVFVLGVIFFIAGIVGLAIWPRYLNDGCCMRCRYDLTGNVSGVCPECGTVFEEKVTQP